MFSFSHCSVFCVFVHIQIQHGKFAIFYRYIYCLSNIYQYINISILSNLLVICVYNLEFTQYQHHLLKDYEVDADEHVNIVEFPENVPPSTIVSGKWAMKNDEELKILHDPKTKARKLYKKYVKTGSEFEINIKSETRRRVSMILDNWTHLLDNYDITVDDLFLIFNDCKEQVMTLLNHSLVRFKDETDYVNATANAQIVVHPQDLSQTIQNNTMNIV